MLSTHPTPLTSWTPSPLGQVLQSWEGRVEEATADGVWVVLVDKTHPQEPEAFSQLTWAAIDPEDHALVVEGAVFYWSIGERGSVLRFRRGVRWSSQALKHTRATAQAPMDRFNCD